MVAAGTRIATTMTTAEIGVSTEETGRITAETVASTVTGKTTVGSIATDKTIAVGSETSIATTVTETT